jgi:hypothetical protein
MSQLWWDEWLFVRRKLFVVFAYGDGDYQGELSRLPLILMLDQRLFISNTLGRFS